MKPIKAAKVAIDRDRNPWIFNTDQGLQITSILLTDVLKKYDIQTIGGWLITLLSVYGDY